MIIVLSESFETAKAGLRKFGVKELNEASQCGVFESDRPFKIVTQAEQTKGLKVDDYIKIGNVDNELLEAVKYRMMGNR